MGLKTLEELTEEQRDEILSQCRELKENEFLDKYGFIRDKATGQLQKGSPRHPNLHHAREVQSEHRKAYKDLKTKLELIREPGQLEDVWLRLYELAMKGSTPAIKLFLKYALPDDQEIANATRADEKDVSQVLETIKENLGGYEDD